MIENLKRGILNVRCCLNVWWLQNCTGGTVTVRHPNGTEANLFDLMTYRPKP